MSLWADDSGAELAPNENFSTSFSNNLLANGTQVLAVCESCEWEQKRYGEGHHIATKWIVLEPKEAVGINIYHKIDTEAEKERKRNSSKQLLTNLDAFANEGKFRAEKKPKLTNEDMARAFVNKILSVKVGLMDFVADDGKRVQMNYIAGISPKEKGFDSNPKLIEKVKQEDNSYSSTTYTPPASSGGSFDDDIDF